MNQDVYWSSSQDHWPGRKALDQQLTAVTSREVLYFRTQIGFIILGMSTAMVGTMLVYDAGTRADLGGSEGFMTIHMTSS